MFDLGEEQNLSPIPRSPKLNKSLQESFYSVATERAQVVTNKISVPRFKKCKLISYIFARMKNEDEQSLAPDSPQNIKDAYQEVTSPAPIQEQAPEHHTSIAQIADSEHGGQEIRVETEDKLPIISLNREEIVEAPLN